MPASRSALSFISSSPPIVTDFMRSIQTSLEYILGKNNNMGSFQYHNFTPFHPPLPSPSYFIESTSGLRFVFWTVYSLGLVPFLCTFCIKFIKFSLCFLHTIFISVSKTCQSHSRLVSNNGFSNTLNRSFAMPCPYSLALAP